MSNVFEDVLNVDDRGIQQVLKEVDNEELAVALKAASEELKNKIFKNMSERAAEMVQDEMSGRRKKEYPLMQKTIPTKILSVPNNPKRGTLVCCLQGIK